MLVYEIFECYVDLLLQVNRKSSLSSLIGATHKCSNFKLLFCLKAQKIRINKHYLVFFKMYCPKINTTESLKYAHLANPGL